MITGLLIISIVSLVAVLSYKRPRLEKRVFKNIPMLDWLNILGFPPMIYIGLVFVVDNILKRTRVVILDFDDFTIINVGVLFMILAFVGQSIHFVSKVISRYLPANKHTLEYQVNEIFHGKLSHYMVMIFSLLTLFMVDLLELNHPQFSPVVRRNEWLIVTAGIILGVSATRTVIFSAGWLGGYFRPVFTLVFLIFIILFSIIRINILDISYYPINLFSVCTYLTVLIVFIVRQIFIFSKLSEKRRLKFITKLFHP